MAQLIDDQLDELEVSDGGSDYGYWRTVDDLTGAGADLWATMPISEKHAVTNNSSENKKTSEGLKERTVGTKKAFQYQGDFQQFGVDGKIYTEIPDTMAGKIVQILKERNQEAINSKKGFLLLMGKLTKKPTPGSGQLPQFTFDLLDATGDIDVVVNETTFPNFIGIGTGGTLTQGAGKEYGMTAFAVT